MLKQRWSQFEIMLNDISEVSCRVSMNSRLIEVKSGILSVKERGAVVMDRNLEKIEMDKIREYDRWMRKQRDKQNRCILLDSKSYARFTGVVKEEFNRYKERAELVRSVIYGDRPSKWKDPLSLLRKTQKKCLDRCKSEAFSLFTYADASILMEDVEKSFDEIELQVFSSLQQGGSKT